MFNILHLFRVCDFTEDFIKFVNGNFKGNRHEFWIYGDRESSHSSIKITSYKNVKYVHKPIDKLKSKDISFFDKIIYHGIFEQDIIDVFFFNRKLLKKLYLRFWGGDKFLYGSADQIYRKKYVVKNAHAIIYIIPEERKFLEQNYEIRGRQYWALYNLHGLIERCAAAESLPQKKRDYISIQVGNSATPSNNHIPILKKLHKFSEENIKIFAPLSYGDKEYAEKVKREGKELFGEKFVDITTFMDADEYNQFMNQMDIAIFGINRQQALGNIQALLYLGKKLYLKKNSIVEHYAKRECHCEVETIDQIDDMDFKSFVDFDEGKALKNKENMYQMSRLSMVTRVWDHIFNENEVKNVKNHLFNKRRY